MSENPLFDEPEKKIIISWDDAVEEKRFPNQKIGLGYTYTLKEAKKEYSKWKNTETGEYPLKFKFHFEQHNESGVKTDLYLTLNEAPKFELPNGKTKNLVYLDKSYEFHVFKISGTALIIEKEFVLPYKTKKGKQYKKGDKERTILMNSFEHLVHAESDSRQEFEF